MHRRLSVARQKQQCLRRHTFLFLKEKYAKEANQGQVLWKPCGSDMLRRGVPVAKLAALLWFAFALLTASLQVTMPHRPDRCKHHHNYSDTRRGDYRSPAKSSLVQRVVAAARLTVGLLHWQKTKPRYCTTDQKTVRKNSVPFYTLHII